MESLFNSEENNLIQQRINKLTPDTKPLWGKMNVEQMLADKPFKHDMPTMKEFKVVPKDF